MPSVRHFPSDHLPWGLPAELAHLPTPDVEVQSWLDAKPEAQQPIYRRAIELLLRHSEDGITMNTTVKPLVAEVATELKPAQLTLARALCLTMAVHNQEPWLHDRMTFHALADIQQWSHTTAANEAIGSPVTGPHQLPERLAIIQVSERTGGNVRASHGWLQQGFPWSAQKNLYHGTMTDGYDGLFPVAVDPDRIGIARSYAPGHPIPGLRGIIIFNPADTTFQMATQHLRSALGSDFSPPVEAASQRA